MPDLNTVRDQLLKRQAELRNRTERANADLRHKTDPLAADFADQAVWDMNLLARDKHVMPWRIEDEMRRVGANFVHAGLWRPFAIRDGNLITGQQNFSGAATAELLVQALGR